MTINLQIHFLTFEKLKPIDSLLIINLSSTEAVILKMSDWSFIFQSDTILIPSNIIFSHEHVHYFFLIYIWIPDIWSLKNDTKRDILHLKIIIVSAL